MSPKHKKMRMDKSDDFSVVTDNEPNAGFIRFEVDKISRLDSNFKLSPEVKVAKLFWQAAVRKTERDGVDYLSLYLIGVDHKSKRRITEMKYDHFLVNSDSTKNIVKRRVKEFNRHHARRGFKLIEWKKLMDEKEEFVKDDKITAEIRFSILKDVVALTDGNTEKQEISVMTIGKDVDGDEKESEEREEKESENASQDSGEKSGEEEEENSSQQSSIVADSLEDEEMEEKEDEEQEAKAEEIDVPVTLMSKLRHEEAKVLNTVVGGMHGDIRSIARRMFINLLNHTTPETPALIWKQLLAEYAANEEQEMIGDRFVETEYPKEEMSEEEKKVAHQKLAREITTRMMRRQFCVFSESKRSGMASQETDEN